MTHISSIGAGMFSDLAVATPLVEFTSTALSALLTSTNFTALFASEIVNAPAGTRIAGAFTRFPNVREFPEIGQPANIVNVPKYGSSVASQINGQADAPTLAMMVNYVPSDWDPSASLLGPMVGDGIQRVFRFTLLNALPSGGFASATAGLGTTQNTQFFWVGKVEAQVYKPELTDANQATVTVSMQNKFFGPFTST